MLRLGHVEEIDRVSIDHPYQSACEGLSGRQGRQEEANLKDVSEANRRGIHPRGNLPQPALR